MNTQTTTAAVAHTFAHDTCAGEYPGCLGAPTEMWDGDEHCAHCAQYARECEIERVEMEMEGELKRAKDARREAEDAEYYAEELARKLAGLKGEAYKPAFKPDTQGAVYALQAGLADLEKGLARVPAQVEAHTSKYGPNAYAVDLFTRLAHEYIVSDVRLALKKLVG